MFTFSTILKLKINLKDKDNTYLYNVALGENVSTEEMYIDSGNEGQSSSILKPKEHLNQFPHITFENNITIKISKLDNYNRNLLKDFQNLLE